MFPAQSPLFRLTLGTILFTVREVILNIEILFPVHILTVFPQFDEHSYQTQQFELCPVPVHMISARVSQAIASDSHLAFFQCAAPP